HRLVVLGGLVFAAVLESDYCPPAKGHQISQQKTISRFDLVLVVLRFGFIARPDRVAGEGQGHVAPAPVIPAAAPFLRARAVGLRRSTVVEKEPRVAFQRVQSCAMGKYPRGADQAAGPFAATLNLARIEQDKVLAGFRARMIAVSH